MLPFPMHLENKLNSKLQLITILCVIRLVKFEADINCGKLIFSCDKNIDWIYQLLSKSVQRFKSVEWAQFILQLF